MEKLTVKDKKENNDPFDQLLENVPNKAVKMGSFNQMKSNVFSPEVSGEEDSSLTRGDGGLFASFSKENLNPKSVLVRPKSNRRRTTKPKKTKTKVPEKKKTHDDTLDVKIIFAKDAASPLPLATRSAFMENSITFERSRLVSSTPVLLKSKSTLSSGRISIPLLLFSLFILNF